MCFTQMFVVHSRCKAQGKEIFCDHYGKMSSYKLVIAMTIKSDVCDSFRIVQRKFERNFDFKTKRFDSDNGGEYVSLEEYLEQHCIQLEYPAPYTAQQN